LKEEIDEDFEWSIEELHHYAKSKVQREASKPPGEKERPDELVRGKKAIYQRWLSTQTQEDLQGNEMKCQTGSNEYDERDMGRRKEKWSSSLRMRKY
jgi:hypothetical protein